MQIWLFSTTSGFIEQVERSLGSAADELKVISRLPSYAALEGAPPDILIIEIPNTQAAEGIIRQAQALRPVVMLGILPPDTDQMLANLVDFGLDAFLIKPTTENMLRVKLKKILRLRKLKEVQLDRERLVKEHLRFYNTLPLGIFELSAQDEILWCNTVAEKMFGYPKEELNGRLIQCIIPKISAPAIRRAFGLRGDEVTGQHKSGSEVIVSVSCSEASIGTPGTSRVLLVENVSSQRHTEAALYDMEARANAILESTISGIITIDDQGHIETFNPAAAKIFGYQPEEVIGKNIRMLMPDPYKREHDLYLNNYHSTGVRKIIGIGREVQGLRKDGSVFPMDLAVNEVVLKNRRIYSGIVRDVTKQRELEKEILQISEQERRNIGQDLHDGLGQMLTALSLMADNLAMKLEREKNPLANEAQKIVRHLEEADTFARFLARGLVPVQLEAYGLASALERLCHQAEQIFRIKCFFEVFGEYDTYTDPSAIHLYRIVQEAISNAVKHGKASQIHVELAVGSDQLRLRIKDNGTGFFPALNKPRGMGVHIMNYRARLIGGTLDIRNSSKGGTIITCTQPLGTGVLHLD
ncbi:MAG: PAS domain S-box protein [Bacteroidetes Order II. Incertae sedis bacterium]|nr:PAS domain S-box protein [Bacteroidetes Order II. bacterium]